MEFIFLNISLSWMSIKRLKTKFKPEKNIIPPRNGKRTSPNNHQTTSYKGTANYDNNSRMEFIYNNIISTFWTLSTSFQHKCQYKFQTRKILYYYHSLEWRSHDRNKQMEFIFYVSTLTTLTYLLFLSSYMETIGKTRSNIKDLMELTC